MCFMCILKYSMSIFHFLTLFLVHFIYGSLKKKYLEISELQLKSLEAILIGIKQSHEIDYSKI